MEISYDEQVDALYIRLLDGAHQCRTLRFSTTVALDIGPNEQLVGIEVLDAKETLRLGAEPVVGLRNLKAQLAG